jgi:hypothetical protein
MATLDGTDRTPTRIPDVSTSASVPRCLASLWPFVLTFVCTFLGSPGAQEAFDGSYAEVQKQ